MDFMETQKSDSTYFISLTNHAPTDSEVTSLVATRGNKVVLSYYKYFPESAYARLFSTGKKLPPGKKVVIFIDHNDKLMDSINPSNKWSIEKNHFGEKFLVVNNQCSVFVIIPAYNETEVIASTVRPLLDKGYEVVIVDDGSTTKIEKFLSGFGVHYLKHEINLGQGAALQTGMSYSKAFNPDYIVHYDADGQHNADDIETFIQVLQEKKAEIVLGSRFLTKETKEMVPVKRRALLKMARLLNWLFTGLLLTDAHNGFRVMKGSALEVIKLKETRMAHATEILRIIKKNRLRYAEAPARISYSAYSMQKGQKPANSINILIDLLLHRFG